MPGLQIAVRYQACDEASGDTYDFIRLGDQKLAIAVGDVTGHGVGANDQISEVAHIEVLLCQATLIAKDLQFTERRIDPR